jgi:hypothetical protein
MLTWLRNLSLKRAAKKYASTLGNRLKSSYGASGTYTPEQISAAVNRLRLDKRYICLGYAAFLTEDKFSGLTTEMPVRLSYQEAREMFYAYVPLQLFKGGPADHGDGYGPPGADL